MTLTEEEASIFKYILSTIEKLADVPNPIHYDNTMPVAIFGNEWKLTNEETIANIERQLYRLINKRDALDILSYARNTVKIEKLEEELLRRKEWAKSYKPQLNLNNLNRI